MMSLSLAIEQADAFIGRILDDPTDTGLGAAVAHDPRGPEALREVLHDRFAHAGEGFGELENDPLFWRVVVVGATTWTAAQRERFAGETLFAAAAPDAYRWMAPIVREIFRPDEAERLLLAAVERGEVRSRLNASYLAYHLFTGEPEYAMSEVGARRLKVADPLGEYANANIGDVARDNT